MNRPEDASLSLVGDWEVEATVPGGGSYTGRVTVRPVGGVVEVEWDTTAGRYVGLGLPEVGAWFVACGEDREGLGLALVRAEGTVRWVPTAERGEVGETQLAPTGVRRWEAGATTAPGFPFDTVALAGTRYLLEAQMSGGPAGRGLALPFPGIAAWLRKHSARWPEERRPRNCGGRRGSIPCPLAPAWGAFPCLQHGSPRRGSP
ncbi:MAG: hypothetical protein H6Q11_597 [Acidobacteria bacterium]|nr:hypothetical protein [Acidobacteriota bacterium]